MTKIIKEKREQTAEQEYENWLKKINQLNLKKINTPLISIKDIKTYLYKRRLARLVFIVIGMKKKCFLNDIYNLIAIIFEVRSYGKDFQRICNKLSEYGLIHIHKLNLIKDKEMLKRYKTLKTKCPVSKIHYYELNNSNHKNIDLLKWCSDIEFKKKD